MTSRLTAETFCFLRLERRSFNYSIYYVRLGSTADDLGVQATAALGSEDLISGSIPNGFWATLMFEGTGRVLLCYELCPREPVSTTHESPCPR